MGTRQAASEDLALLPFWADGRVDYCDAMLTNPPTPPPLHEKHQTFSGEQMQLFSPSDVIPSDQTIPSFSGAPATVEEGGVADLLQLFTTKVWHRDY